MKTKITAVALLAVTAGVFAYTHQNNTAPSDLRDAVADNSAVSQLGGERGTVAAPEPRPEAVSKGYVAGNAPCGSSCGSPVEFVTIPGGRFTMGSDTSGADFVDAKPVHRVTIQTFQMAKTAVTVEQYAECVSQGRCTAPDTGLFCNWGEPGRQQHPVNCVDWDQAQAYAKFKGARLPSEAEFEYAATSGGRNQKYPWGNEEATIELAVFNANRTMPVCSRFKGNTEQGLCDMSGNVFQWVQDVYKSSYERAPVDGSAYEGAGSNRVLRGGSFGEDYAMSLRADYRHGSVPGRRHAAFGFRLAR